jgi:7-carboxy-7-deazaguanine synthase
MRVNEIFLSRQGEGRLTGVDSVFVRVTGCNLRCDYCDTPYASWNPEGEDLSLEEIIGRTILFDCRHVVITGGEPMLYPELVRLTEMLHERERHITIETAGTVDQPVVCDLMSISPKLANSTPGPEAGDWVSRHIARRHRPDVIQRLVTDYDYQLKFVVDLPEDCEEVVSYLKEFPEAKSEQVLLMPQGTEASELEKRAEWLVPYCESQGFTFCPRRQIEWYGNKRRT